MFCPPLPSGKMNYSGCDGRMLWDSLEIQTDTAKVKWYVLLLAWEMAHSLVHVHHDLLLCKMPDSFVKYNLCESKNIWSNQPYDACFSICLHFPLHTKTSILYVSLTFACCMRLHRATWANTSYILRFHNIQNPVGWDFLHAYILLSWNFAFSLLGRSSSLSPVSFKGSDP
jgi:hypothetical protein